MNGRALGLLILVPKLGLLLLQLLQLGSSFPPLFAVGAHVHDLVKRVLLTVMATLPRQLVFGLMQFIIILTALQFFVNVSIFHLLVYLLYSHSALLY